VSTLSSDALKIIVTLLRQVAHDNSITIDAHNVAGQNFTIKGVGTAHRASFAVKLVSPPTIQISEFACAVGPAEPNVFLVAKTDDWSAAALDRFVVQVLSFALNDSNLRTEVTRRIRSIIAYHAEDKMVFKTRLYAAEGLRLLEMLNSIPNDLIAGITSSFAGTDDTGEKKYRKRLTTGSVIIGRPDAVDLTTDMDIVETTSVQQAAINAHHQVVAAASISASTSKVKSDKSRAASREIEVATQAAMEVVNKAIQEAEKTTASSAPSESKSK
jgi:hypothetical protein